MLDVLLWWSSDFNRHFDLKKLEFVKRTIANHAVMVALFWTQCFTVNMSKPVEANHVAMHRVQLFIVASESREQCPTN